MFISFHACSLLRIILISSQSSTHQKTKGAQTDMWLDVTTVTRHQITACEARPAAF